MEAPRGGSRGRPRGGPRGAHGALASKGKEPVRIIYTLSGSMWSDSVYQHLEPRWAASLGLVGPSLKMILFFSFFFFFFFLIVVVLFLFHIHSSSFLFSSSSLLLLLSLFFTPPSSFSPHILYAAAGKKNANAATVTRVDHGRQATNAHAHTTTTSTKTSTGKIFSIFVVFVFFLSLLHPSTPHSHSHIHTHVLRTSDIYTNAYIVIYTHKFMHRQKTSCSRRKEARA